MKKSPKIAKKSQKIAGKTVKTVIARKSFPSEAPGRALARTGAERGHRSTRPYKANKSPYKIIKSTTSSVLV